MRTTLRGSSGEASTHRMRMPSLRKHGSKKSKFPSRFDDSSDDDTGRPVPFRSRFGDSSDEETVDRELSREPGQFSDNEDDE